MSYRSASQTNRKIEIQKLVGNDTLTHHYSCQCVAAMQRLRYHVYPLVPLYSIAVGSNPELVRRQCVGLILLLLLLLSFLSVALDLSFLYTDTVRCGSDSSSQQRHRHYMCARACVRVARTREGTSAGAGACCVLRAACVCV